LISGRHLSILTTLDAAGPALRPGGFEAGLREAPPRSGWRPDRSENEMPEAIR